MWKDNKDLPEYDREVIALQAMPSGSYKVVYAHRPNPAGYIVVDEVGKAYAKTYDESGWNMPDIKWWLDLEMPYKE